MFPVRRNQHWHTGKSQHSNCNLMVSTPSISLVLGPPWPTEGNEKVKGKGSKTQSKVCLSRRSIPLKAVLEFTGNYRHLYRKIFKSCQERNYSYYYCWDYPTTRRLAGGTDPFSIKLTSSLASLTSSSKASSWSSVGATDTDLSTLIGDCWWIIPPAMQMKRSKIPPGVACWSQMRTFSKIVKHLFMTRIDSTTQWSC